MEYSLLDNSLKEKISLIITKILNKNTTEVNSIYEAIKKSDKAEDCGEPLSSEFLCANLKPYKDCPGLGIDFPIWFDWDSEKPKTMIIGRDSQRSHNDNKLIIGTPFGIGTQGGRKTKKNKYWQFVEPILNSHKVYITDVFKLFTKDKTKAKELRKDTDFHYKILKKEIEVIKPNKIITIGKDAKIAIKKILETEINENEHDNQTCFIRLSNGLELFFVPHISPLVLQNINTVANLFISIGKLKNNFQLEEAGAKILKHKNELL